MGDSVGVKYIGKDSVYEDNILRTGLSWEKGEVHVLPIVMAKEFLKHPTVFQETAGGWPVLSSPSGPGVVLSAGGGEAGLAVITSIVDVSTSLTVPTTDNFQRAINYTGGASAVLSSGAIGMSEGAGAAVYAEISLKNSVTRMGCEFMFTGPDANKGAVCIIPWLTSKPNGNQSSDIPATGIHAVFKNSGWTVDYFDSGMQSLVTYASGTYALKLVNGVPYRVEWVRNGNSLTIVLPDGQIVGLENENIASRVGPHACFELFRTGTTTSPCSIMSMWASDVTQKIISQPPGQASSPYQIKKSVVELTTITPTAIPQTKTVIEANKKIRVFGGASGKVKVTFSQYVLMAASATLLYGPRVTTEGGTIVKDGQVAAVKGAYEGRVSADMIISVPTSEPCYVEWTIQASGPSCAMYCSADKPAIMTLTPL